MKTKRSLSRIVGFMVGAFLVLLVLAEAGLRMVGVVDFPLYTASSDIGYLPAPDQKGDFLGEYDWYVNDRSMGVPAPYASHAGSDLLLIGDSLVWGGNSYRQADKLGPVLAQIWTSGVVWPIGAGSWGALNAVNWLNRNSDVQDDVGVVVWILNSADFEGLSVWRSNTVHPVEKPSLALTYVLQKYLMPKLVGRSSTEATAPKSVNRIQPEAVSAFQQKLAELQSTGKRVLIVLYPDKFELTDADEHYQDFKEALKKAMHGCCALLEVRGATGWNVRLYKDSIHPTPEGNRVLADLIITRLGEPFR